MVDLQHYDRLIVEYKYYFDSQGVKEKLEEDEDASISDDSDKTLSIPKGTPLAYNVCELYVKNSGALELIIEKDALGGFAAGLDGVDKEAEETWNNGEIFSF